MERFKLAILSRQTRIPPLTSLVVSVALCVFASCGGGGNTVGPDSFSSAQNQALQLTPSPSSINFGSVAVGSHKTETMTVSNPGTGEVAISQATATGGGFALSGPSLPVSLEPGQSASFSATFAPAAAGEASGSVSILSSAGKTPVAVSLSGTGSAHQSATLDIYGGDAAAPCSGGATAYFEVQKDSQDHRWWFCDPAGNHFYLNAVEVVNGSDANGYGNIMSEKYHDTRYRGYGALINRLQAYGFNAVSDNSSLYALPVKTVAGAGNPTQAPFIYLYEGARGNLNQAYPFKDLFSTASPAYTGWRADTLPDVFDPNFASHASATSTHDSPWGTGETFTSFSALDASPWLVGVEVGDTDDLASFKIARPQSEGVGWHIGWFAATAAPYEVYSGRWYHVFSNPNVETKQAWAAWLQQTGNGGPGYPTIQDLNAAWGSDYSTFGSSGVSYSETIGIGDGKTTSFSYTLKHTVVDPMSVAIVMNSSTVSGDCPWFDNTGYYLRDSDPHDCGKGIPVKTGVIGTMMTTYGTSGVPMTSPALTSGGTIDYLTGQLIVTFATAPTAGTIIKTNYTAGGWPHSLTGGKGLLDEDGTNDWFPQQWCLPDLLENNPPQVDLDLDNFMTYYAGRYFSTVASAVRKLLPHHLVLSPSFLGAYDRPGILQQAAKYLDVIDLQEVDDPSQLVAAYGIVKKPIYLDERFTANPDSQFAEYPCATTNPQLSCQPTQAARGRAYVATYQRDLALKGADGDGFLVGWNFLEMTDITGQHMNYGLFSQLDNGYNGVEDQEGPKPCLPEVTAPGYVCGNAPGNYGDFLTPVARANLSWLLP